MVIVGMDRDEEAVGLLAERMVQRISVPYRIREHDITVGLSVGIAFSAVHGDGPDDLVKNADMALYKSKRDGRGRYCVFRPEMDAEAQKRRQLEIDIRQAIHESAFTVAYQPIVEIETGKVKCCEALVRWLNNGVNVPPNAFIPVAEETGMIVDIGGIVLRKACLEAMRWPGDTMVAVNVSDVQFRRNAVVGQVVEALRLSGLPARRLELEITESLAMENQEHTLAVLSELRRIGVRIALDDFGTGHTALSYLDKIPHDKVKIDRAFISDIVGKESKRKIVQFVASYNTDVDVVAEGSRTRSRSRSCARSRCRSSRDSSTRSPSPATRSWSSSPALRRAARGSGSSAATADGGAGAMAPASSRPPPGRFPSLCQDGCGGPMTAYARTLSSVFDAFAGEAAAARACSYESGGRFVTREAADTALRRASEGALARLSDVDLLSAFAERPALLDPTSGCPGEPADRGAHSGRRSPPPCATTWNPMRRRSWRRGRTPTPCPTPAPPRSALPPPTPLAAQARAAFATGAWEDPAVAVLVTHLAAHLEEAGMAGLANDLRAAYDGRDLACTPPRPR